MDGLTLLIADHNRVRGVFARFQEAEKSGEVAEMADLAGTIDTELTVHTDIEETVFYPWAHRLSGDIAEVVDEGIEEHHVVKTLLDEIRDLEPGDPQWVAKVTVVIENVEHHAEEEEAELFPQVRARPMPTPATRSAASSKRARPRWGPLCSPTSRTSPPSSSTTWRPSRRSPVDRRWITTSSPPPSAPADALNRISPRRPR